MRNNFRIVMLAACHCMMTGCALWNAPPDTGPMFSLGEIPPAEPVGSISINFQDARPKWERRYYSGTVNPRNYEWAMTFVPMQNFQPDFEKHLQAEIIELSQSFQERPSAVSVKLTSFAMSFNDVDNRKAVFEHIKAEEELRRKEEREAERERERREEAEHAALHSRGLHFPNEDDDELSIGGQIASALIEGVVRMTFFLVTSVVPALATEGVDGLTTGNFDLGGSTAFRNGKKLSVKPPDELRNRNYGHGLTCEFRAVVSFQWDDGTNFQTDVTGWSYESHPVGKSTFGTEDVSESVRAAIRDMRYDLSRQTIALQKPESRKRLAAESNRISL